MSVAVQPDPATEGQRAELEAITPKGEREIGALMMSEGEAVGRVCFAARRRQFVSLPAHAPARHVRTGLFLGRQGFF